MSDSQSKSWTFWHKTRLLHPFLAIVHSISNLRRLFFQLRKTAGMAAISCWCFKVLWSYLPLHVGMPGISFLLFTATGATRGARRGCWSWGILEAWPMAGRSLPASGGMLRFHVMDWHRCNKKVAELYNDNIRDSWLKNEINFSGMQQ